MIRRLIFVLIFTCSCNLIWADAITEMAKWQAEKVSSYLQGENYIMPYCDCCSNDQLVIVQMEKVTVEPTENDMYQVRLRGKILVSFDTDNLGRCINAKPSTKYYNDLVSLNYTFITLNSKLMSISLGLGIDIDEITSCHPFIDIPSPQSPVLSGNEKYKEWYNKNVESIDYNSLLVGSWNLRMVKNNYGETINTPLPDWRIVFKSDKTFFTNMGKGGTGKWTIVNGEIEMTSDESGKKVASPFKIEDNFFYMKMYEEKQGLATLIFAK